MTNEEKAKNFALRSLKDQIELKEKEYLHQVKENELVLSLVDAIMNLHRNCPLALSNFFHDLDLPSGNKWLFIPSIRMKYDNVRSYKLPTTKDIYELFEHCQFKFRDVYDGIKVDDGLYNIKLVDLTIVSKSGKETQLKKIPCSGGGSLVFWVSDFQTIGSDISVPILDKDNRKAILSCSSKSLFPLAIVLK